MEKASINTAVMWKKIIWYVATNSNILEISSRYGFLYVAITCGYNILLLQYNVCSIQILFLLFYILLDRNYLYL